MKLSKPKIVIITVVLIVVIFFLIDFSIASSRAGICEESMKIIESADKSCTQDSDCVTVYTTGVCCGDGIINRFSNEKNRLDELHSQDSSLPKLLLSQGDMACGRYLGDPVCNKGICESKSILP